MDIILLCQASVKTIRAVDPGSVLNQGRCERCGVVSADGLDPKRGTRLQSGIKEGLWAASAAEYRQRLHTTGSKDDVPSNGPPQLLGACSQLILIQDLLNRA